jgi:hypothetical protein
MTVFVEALNAGVPHKKEREKGGIEQSPIQFHHRAIPPNG